MCVVSAVWGTETNLQSAVTQEDRSLYWALVILQERANLQIYSRAETVDLLMSLLENN